MAFAGGAETGPWSLLAGQVRLLGEFQAKKKSY